MILQSAGADPIDWEAKTTQVPVISSSRSTLEEGWVAWSWRFVHVIESVRKSTLVLKIDDR